MGVTTRGLRYPESTDPPIGDDDTPQIALLADDIDAAMSALVTDTGSMTNAPVTAAAGWSVLIAEYRLIGKDCTLHVWLKRTGAAVTASSTGNVAGDPDLFTITDSTLRPSFDLVTGTFRASFTGGSYQITSVGVCSLFDMHSSSSIAAPDNDGTYHTLQVYTNYPVP